MITAYLELAKLDIKQFLNSRIFWLLNLLFLLIGVYASLYGRHEVAIQQDNINLLKSAIDSTNRIVASKLQKQDTIASWHYDDWLYALHSNRPDGLAGLSFGQRDLHRYAVSIAIGTYFYNRYAGGYENKTLSGEIVNPQKQFAGHLDVSYVLIFLLPLYLILISYNLLSSEKEQGTLDILLIQGINNKGLVLTKLAVRLGLGLIIGWTLLFVASAVNNAFFSIRLIYFFIGTLAYILCWISFIAVIIALQRSSGANALILICVWLTFCLAIPATGSAYVDAVYPPNPKADLTEAVQKANARVFNTSRKALSIRFYSSYPHYNNIPRDTFPGGWYNPRWMRAVHLLLDDEVKPLEDRYQRQLQARLAFSDRVEFLSPALLVQSIFDRSAASDMGQMLAYDQSVYYHFAEWRDYIDKRTFLKSDRLTRKDYRELPRTDFTPGIDDSAILDRVAALLIFTALAISGASVLLKKHTRYARE